MCLLLYRYREAPASFQETMEVEEETFDLPSVPALGECVTV